MPTAFYTGHAEMVQALVLKATQLCCLLPAKESKRASQLRDKNPFHILNPEINSFNNRYKFAGLPPRKQTKHIRHSLDNTCSAFAACHTTKPDFTNSYLNFLFKILHLIFLKKVCDDSLQ